LDTDYQATATLLLSLASSQHSHPQLALEAGRLGDELRRLGSVGRVRLFGEVPERIELWLNPTNLTRLPLALEEIAGKIAARNTILPGSAIQHSGQDVQIHVTDAFRDEQEIREAVLGVGPDGVPLRVQDVFDVRRGHEEPIPFSVETLHRGTNGPLRRERSVLLAVEMKSGEIIGQFKRAVEETAAGLSRPEGMSLIIVSDQPAATAKRIGQFIECFIEAIIIVVLVCLLLMDWRTALVVAIAIPLTLALTLGGMALLNIPLQQISIAALIIALGMLVDDPVVAADGINRELANGQPRSVAAWLGPWRLRRAILFGTIINIVAFLPLMLLPGDMGAFIVALPQVITLALIASRIVSVTFIPCLGHYLLKGQRGFEVGGEVRSFWLFKPVDSLLRRLLPRYQRGLQWSLKHPAWTVAVAYGLLVASFGLTPFFGHQFFPPAERHQCLVDIQLPPGASITQTRQVCDQVAGLLQEQPSVQNAAIFCGGTAPNFYYNVLPHEPAPNLAQVLINTWHERDVPGLIVTLRAELDRTITNAICIARQLDQGPALEAPIMIRVTGPEVAGLRQPADAISAALKEAGGYQVSNDLGAAVPTVEVQVDQERAAPLGLTSLAAAQALRVALAGFDLTELRQGGQSLPVQLRFTLPDPVSAEALGFLPVQTPAGDMIPLGAIASLNTRPAITVLSRSGGQSAVTIKAFARFGELPSEILRRARRVIDGLTLPPGYALEYAGEARELKNSQIEMTRVMKISLALIGLAMVVQFGSVMKSLVVMLTVPLGLTGAFLGLAVTGASFGFMALLGIVSLGGVIVSHIIVLADFVEEARRKGADIKEALAQAGLVRLRAVLVTVLATVCGLIPLALKGGELWRPLTAVHIFGLLLATALTLVVLPVWYYLFTARLRWIK